MQRSFLGLSRECQNCGAAAPIWDTACVDCGNHILSSSWVRMGGIIFIVIGVGLTATIGYLMWWIARVMAHSGDPGAVNRFTGTPLQGVVIFAILSAVCMFGITYTAMGVWWLLRATRNPWILRTGWIGYLLIAAAYAIMQLWMD